MTKSEQMLVGAVLFWSVILILNGVRNNKRHKRWMKENFPEEKE